MENKKSIEMVDLYFDGELRREDEAYLFSLISTDEEGREYFKTLSTLKESYRISENVFPQKLEDKILKEISSNTEIKTPDKYYFIPKKIAYACSVILALVGIFIYAEYNINQERMKLQDQQVEQHTEMIELLMNSLPQAEIKGAEVKKVIVRANIGEI